MNLREQIEERVRGSDGSLAVAATAFEIARGMATEQGKRDHAVALGQMRETLLELSAMYGGSEVDQALTMVLAIPHDVQRALAFWRRHLTAAAAALRDVERLIDPEQDGILVQERMFREKYRRELAMTREVVADLPDAMAALAQLERKVS